MSKLFYCSHCEKSLGNKWFIFHEKKNTTDNTKLWEELNITSLCCKTHILTTLPDDGYMNMNKYNKSRD